MSKFEGIAFCRIPEDRYEDVIEHLRNNFFADEPLNKSVALCDPGQPHAELEKHSLTTLRDQLSYMAMLEDTGQVIAVALNGVQHPGDLEASQAKLATMEDKKFRQIFDLLYSVNIQLNLFRRYGVDKIFECRILSVDKDHRGRGLARELLRLSEAAAKEEGFKVFKEDATGLFSQRVAESLGMHTVHSVLYAEYLDSNGDPIFVVPEPHRSLNIMVKLLK